MLIKKITSIIEIAIPGVTFLVFLVFCWYWLFAKEKLSRMRALELMGIGFLLSFTLWLIYFLLLVIASCF